jgi:hypothetical protein
MATSMRGSISVRSVGRRTVRTYAEQASVLLPAAAVTVVIVAAVGTRPAKSSPALAIGALIVTVAVIALFAGVVVKLAAEVWEGRAAVSPREFLASVRPVLGVVVLFAVFSGACSRVIELAARAAGHGPGVALQLLAATVLVPIPLLGVTALYFELRRVAAGDLS